MSQTVCPSCGASFMTPWPQCPICGATIPASATAPSGSSDGIGAGPSFDSSEPFVPPAYDNPIPAPGPARPAAAGAGGAGAASGKSASTDFPAAFDSPSGFGSAGGFGAGSRSAAPAAEGSGFGLESSRSNASSFNVSGGAGASSGGFGRASSAPLTSPPGESGGGSSMQFARDDDPGFDPSSFRAFDFTKLDVAKAEPEPPPPPPSTTPASIASSGAPVSSGSLMSPAAPANPGPNGFPGPNGAGGPPPAFRGAGAAPAGGFVPPAFRNPAGGPAAPGQPGATPEIDAAPKPGEFPSSFSDLTSPANRNPAARRTPPNAAARGPNGAPIEGAPLGDDALSTAGLAPVRVDDRSLTERALELQKEQSEQKQRTGLATLLMVTLLLAVLTAGAAFAVVRMVKNQQIGPQSSGSVVPPVSTGTTGTPTIGSGETPGPESSGSGESAGTSTQTVSITPPPPGSVKVDEETALNVNLMRTAPRDVAARASDALIAKGSVAVPALAPLLSDNDVRVRLLAATTLGRIGSAAAPATIPLLEAFDTGPLPLQRETARALTSIGAPAAPGLAQRYKPGADLNRRLLVVTALDDLGAAAEPAVPTLVEALEDGEDRVRTTALSALKKIGPPAFGAVNAALNSKVPTARMAACEYMSNQGPSAVAAAPALIELLSDPTERVRDYAQHALGRMGEGAVEGLLTTLKSTENDDVRHRTAKALGRIGDPALDPLIELLGKSPPSLALYCAEALGEMGPRAKPALEALTAATQRGSRDLRFYADEAIRKIRD